MKAKFSNDRLGLNDKQKNVTFHFSSNNEVRGVRMELEATKKEWKTPTRGNNSTNAQDGT